jgi:crotonobetainyl-CoA:carnitine CoA-transferase CaiB-like acyl-CoA transferase
MLSPYRALDLTDEKGVLCGKLLGDLGADVIKVERPGGDATRRLSPFYHDEVDPEKSLFWFAYNASKRGITLDIETVAGQGIFKKLVERADFVIESFAPGYLDKLGLSYPSMEKINPGVIMVSITPFGQAGPYRDYKGPDIVTWAMGGRIYSVGDADRPPVRVSHHSQAYLQAGLEAAMAASMALYHRNLTGEGQHVDLSIQAAAAQTGNTTWDVRKVVPQRIRQSGNVKVPRVYQCKDGVVNWFYMPAQFEPWRNAAFVRWMESEGYADDFLREFDWSKLDYATITQETMDRIAEPTTRFFQAHSKVELLEGAVKHRILFYPHFTTSDILKSAQLEARDFWAEVAHPELGATITYPGAFARASEAPIRTSCRAPHIGEHNRDIYEKELGISGDELRSLIQAGVI